MPKIVYFSPSLETSPHEKIFILLSRFPYPLDKGDKLRAYYFIKQLSYKYRVFLCTLSDVEVSDHEIQELKPFCEQIKVLPLSKIGTFLSLMKGLFNGIPFQVNYFQNSAHQATVKDLVSSFNPNKIFIQLPRMAEYVRNIQDIEKTIDYQDCFSKIMQGRADAGTWPLNILYNIEAKRMQQYEADIFSSFQKHLIISQADLEALKMDSVQKKQIKIAPNGVDNDYYKPYQEPINKEFDVFFAGNMNYPPNIEAAVYLVDRVMPLVWKLYPNAKVLLVGTEPHRRVKALESANVKVTGWVEDIRPWFAKSKMLVAPMFLGAGLQNKLLQAMAMQIPCITTPLANSALGANPNEEISVGTNEKEISEQIINLLQNPDKAEQLAEAGYQFIQNKFSWDAAVEWI